MTLSKVTILPGGSPIKAQTLFMATFGPFFILLQALFLASWLLLGSEFHLLFQICSCLLDVLTEPSFLCHFFLKKILNIAHTEPPGPSFLKSPRVDLSIFAPVLYMQTRHHPE